MRNRSNNNKAIAALARNGTNTDDLRKTNQGLFRIAVTTKTANYTATLTDRVILCDATSGNITITLPDPATCYNTLYSSSVWFSISKIDTSSNTVTIAPFNTETIAGQSSVDLIYDNEVVSILTDGTNWYLRD